MKKITIPQVNLSLHMQDGSENEDGKPRHGILSKQDEGSYLFEETVRNTASPRNPKLYDGKYVSLVRKRNGQYQPYLKKLSIDQDFEPHDFAHQVYNELISALNYVNH